MFPRGKAAYMRPATLGSHRRTVDLRKPKAQKKKNAKSHAQSDHQLEKRNKKIVVTREVYTRSEHSPETPPRILVRAVRLSRSGPRRRASTMSIPSTSLPPSRASNGARSATQTTIDGLQFREDPQFQTWHRSLFGGYGAGTTFVEAVENDAGLQDRITTYEEIPKEPEPCSGNTEPTLLVEQLGEPSPPAPAEMLRCSSESHSDDYKSSLCAPMRFSSTGIGWSASSLKARVAQKMWLGKSIKERLRSSKAEELPQIQETRPVWVPQKATIRRKLRLQKKSGNLRVSGGIEEEATRSHATLRVNDSDVEEPRPSNFARSSLEAMLHDPNQNRFSASWDKFVEEQTQGKRQQDWQPPLEAPYISGEAPTSRVVLSSIVTTQALVGEAESKARSGDQSQSSVIVQVPTSDPFQARAKADLPVIKISQSADKARTLLPPNPGPRTSSKHGIFAKFIGPGTPPSLIAPATSPSPLMSRPRPSNISRPRKASESSFSANFDDATNPAHSTDTLAKIEVELHTSPLRSERADVVNRSTRSAKNLSIDSGPSGSAPNRALPQLPGDDDSERSRSRGSSRKPHARKYISISFGHARDERSTSSLSTVRGISPSTNGRSEIHTKHDVWRVHANAPQSITYRKCLDMEPFDNLAPTRSEALRSPTSISSPDHSFSAPPEAFLRKQVQKDARAESRRLIKLRDLASHGAIEEENENDIASPLSNLDPLNQFTLSPSSRSAGRGSTRRAQPIQRSQPVSRRPAHRGFARQVLGASGVMVVADASPMTPNFRSRRLPLSSNGSPLRETASESFDCHSKHGLLKKASSLSIRSHRSNSALTVNGAHTPPSSDPSASDDEAAVVVPYRITLRREIEEVKAMMIMQSRAIDKLQNMMRLYMPTGRSRSRDISLDRQRSLGPSSSRYPQGAISSVSSTRAASDTGPGPAIVPEGFGFDIGGALTEDRRLSGAPVAVKMDSMVDGTFVRLP